MGRGLLISRWTTWLGAAVIAAAIAVEVICDDSQGHYEIMYAGWVGDRRVHGSALHIDLRYGKIWIQHDGTEHGVATELLEAGAPPTDLVLAFHAPDDRKHTPFAIG